MKPKGITSVLLFIISLFSSSSIVAQNSESGYIIAVDDETIYLNLTSTQVSQGDILIVFENEVPIASIEISDAENKFSLAKAIPQSSLSKIKAGMSVRFSLKRDKTQQEKTTQADTSITPNNVLDDSGKPGVYIAPAQVNDVVGVGHFGGYVSDILMEQLMFCEGIRLLDRSILNQQVDEINLTGDYIDPSTAIERGKIIGAKYAIQVSMQKPDVVNVKTGVPLASIMGALSMGLNKNIGAQYMSNVEVATLQASVSITARVVDLETGEILFMASGNGKAKGKSQMSLEYGALGGAKLNDGAEGFKQTVTGQAIQKAFITIGRNLNSYFNGETTSKVMGSASGYGNYSDKLEKRGLSLYMGVDKLDNDAVKNLFYENSEMYFKYRNAKRLGNWGYACIAVGVAATIAGITYTALEENDGFFDELFYNRYDPTGLILTSGGIAFATAGIIMNVSAHKKVKSIVAEYNNKSLVSQYSLDLVVPNGGGLGLRLTF